MQLKHKEMSYINNIYYTKPTNRRRKKPGFIGFSAIQKKKGATSSQKSVSYLRGTMVTWNVFLANSYQRQSNMHTQEKII